MSWFNILFFVLILVIIIYQFRKRQNKGAAEAVDESADNNELTQDQIARKAKSIAYLKHCQIPVFEHLPYIESEEETTLRTKEEIVNRAIALCYMGLWSEDQKNEGLKTFEDRYDVLEHLSPDELMALKSEIPTRQQVADANWRYESLFVLLWSLSLIEKLPFPATLCDLQKTVGIIFENSREDLLQKSTVRGKDEILDLADLIYRMHWAIRNARVNDAEPPKDLNRSVVYERHYSLNWLINYMDEDWDEISTDT